MAPNGLDFAGLLPHQPQGVKFLSERPRAMLAWDMRTCKTSTALRAWECDPRGQPALVLCPATARANWRREALRFCLDPTLPPNVQVIYNSNVAIDRAADLVICNYDKLDASNMPHRLRDNLGRRRWGLLINDEAKYLKNPNAARTKAVYGGGKKNQKPLIDFADRVWLLEGTPMPNHPGELWTHAHYLWPESTLYNGKPMELWQWELQYCQLAPSDYGNGHKIVGGKNLQELKERLSPHIHRLKYEDAFGSGTLPRIDTWPLDMGDTRVLVPDMPELVAKLAQRFGSLDQIDQFDQHTLDAYLACIHAEHDALASLRRDTGTLKAVAVTLLLRHELTHGDDGKTIVFAWHHDAIDTLASGLRAYNPAVLHGGTRDRDAQIEKFWHDTTCRVFIGQVQTAGQAIDLSCSNNIVFAEQSWVPGENAQASLRASGPRQSKAVSVRYTYLPGSVDENVVRANARKARAITTMFG
jgi:SWI/SNF-related matrix-associated actin-dependent regulator 1 of chromatin subfamily A